MTRLLYFLRTPYPYLFIILSGTTIKLIQLPQAFFWADEIATIYHVNGQDGSSFFSNQNLEIIRPASHFVEQLHLSDRPDGALGAQLRRLGQKPQFTPLHYAYLTFWYRLFGDDPLSYRWFTLFCYGLGLVTLYFLGAELFGISLGGWVTASLFSVSPYMHFAALPARYYMLFLLAAFGAHLFLLYALRLGERRWWIWYALAVAHLLYVSFLGILVLASQLIFVLWAHRSRWKSFFLAFGIGVVAYIPWVTLLAANYEDMYQAMEWHKLAAFTIPEIILFQLTYAGTLIAEPMGLSPLGIFFASLFGGAQVQILLTSILTAIFGIYAFYIFLKHADIDARALIIPLIVLGSLFLFWSDLFRKTFISAVPRYQLVLQSGVFLLFAFFFTLKVEARSPLFSILFLICIGLGIFSLSRQLGQRCLGPGPNCAEPLAVAQYLDQPGRNLLIVPLSDRYAMDYVLSVLEESSAKELDVLPIDLSSDLSALIPSNTYDRIYLYEIWPEMEAELKEIFGTRMVEEKTGVRTTLWSLEQ